MKTLLTLAITFLTLGSFAQGPQTWPDAFNQEDVNSIKELLESFKVEGEIDIEKVIERTVFPFSTGNSTYTKEKFAEAFDELFSDELLNELAQSESYEVMTPEGESYMNVCMNKPDGYSGAVVTFTRVKGIWMLSGMGLY